MEFKINIQIKIGNKANVTIVLNQDIGATVNYVDKKTSEVTSKLADYLTKSDFSNEKKTINNSLDNKVNNSDFNNFKTDNTSKLSNKADKSDLKNYAKQSDLDEVEENVNNNINDDNSPINQKISNLQSDKASHDDLNQTKNNLQGSIDHKVDDNQDGTVTVNQKVLTPADKHDVETAIKQSQAYILDLNTPKFTDNPEYDSSVNPNQWFFEEL